MINFFRKIRKKLADNNKPLKYARYAIGEIVLVVIGILIALQINNWNQKQQERKIIESYLVKIGIELKDDTQSLELLIKERKQALKYTDTILEYFRRNHVSNSKLFEKGFFSVFVETRFYPNKSAYESLKSSGYMKDLENPEIEEKFNQYYQLVENLLFVENKYNSITQPVETSLAEKGFYNDYQDIFKWNNTDTIQFTIQSMKKYPEYQATFIKANMFLEELITYYSELLDKAKETNNLIENRD